MHETVLIGIVTAIVALTKVVEILITKLLGKDKGSTNGTSNGHNGKINEIAGKVDQLVLWHDARDPNGVPLGYFPRSIVESQEKIADTLRECAHAQEKITENLRQFSDRVERGFDKLDERLDDVERDIERATKASTPSTR